MKDKIDTILNVVMLIIAASIAVRFCQATEPFLPNFNTQADRALTILQPGETQLIEVQCLAATPTYPPSPLPTPTSIPTSTPPPIPTPTPAPMSTLTPVPPDTTYLVLRAETPPVIDGDLTEYNEANVIEIVQVSMPARGLYRLLWDDNALYIAAKVEDVAMVANITEEDGTLWIDDSIELFLDTLHDHGQRLRPDDYKFFVNLLNVHRDNRGTDNTWDGIYHSAVRTADESYTIEISIPWSTFGLSAPTPGAIWGLDISLNNNNGTKTQQMPWANSNGLGKNDPDGWGDMQFHSADISVREY